MELDRRGRLGLDEKMIGAGPLAKSARQRSGSTIIRCTLSGFCVQRRTASTTTGPIVIFGTKRPSITSTWIQSAPAASTARTSSASRPKSADKIDGATMIGLCGAASGLADLALNAFESRLTPSHKYT